MIDALTLLLIAAALAHPDVTTFAIVDDGSDMVHLTPRLVHTSWEFGLLAEHIEPLCALLTPKD